MKRRNFLKMFSLSPFLGLVRRSKASPPRTGEGDIKVIESEVQAREYAQKHIKDDILRKVFDVRDLGLFPGEIIDMTTYHDSLIICTRTSVWQLMDEFGEMTVRKLS